MLWAIVRRMEGRQDQITVLGVGNILFRDEGVGIRVIERLVEKYGFPENVSLVDGGVLGFNLLGIISDADRLIVVDAIRNGGNPGDLYRLVGDEIPKRVFAKNSLHQVDLLEALDRVPETVIIGVEPEDISTLSIELSEAIHSRIDHLVEMVLDELDQLGVTYQLKKS
jgi:hydrogenase maturation protease